ncbi:hypothetical protein HPB50_011470 [Hyalomma asiaticum]|uniref:Uncharacterized protein n=1 Tax=Hyalomma asiaticum TaxID=266040 RepID=A0ACB7RQX2_HYAAI|nr:hypothetical protein HPB50_011470 [Hyalomma asiaticum]
MLPLSSLLRGRHKNAEPLPGFNAGNTASRHYALPATREATTDCFTPASKVPHKCRRSGRTIIAPGR